MRLLLTICLTAVFVSATSFAQRPNSSLSRAQIKDAEQTLSDLGYWTGRIDGVFDANSRSALVAFQKYERREMTGQLTTDELDAIRTNGAPQARETGYAHVEVDVDRQILMLIDEQGRARVLPVSTGNDKTFISEGQTSIAYTPRGRFMVYDKEAGWGSGPLGAMYYSNYISGGVAIHGSPNVPTQAASHGCIRVPMFAARQLSKLMPVGTIVLVYDKVSFVSAKDWATNPQRKQAALEALTTYAFDYVYEPDANKIRPRTVIKKTLPRINRA